MIVIAKVLIEEDNTEKSMKYVWVTQIVAILSKTNVLRVAIVRTAVGNSVRLLLLLQSVKVLLVQAFPKVLTSVLD